MFAISMNLDKEIIILDRPNPMELYSRWKYLKTNSNLLWNNSHYIFAWPDNRRIAIMMKDEGWLNNGKFLNKECRLFYN